MKKPKHRWATEKKKSFQWHLLAVELCLQEMVRASSWVICNSAAFKRSTELLNIAKGVCLLWSQQAIKTTDFSNSTPVIFYDSVQNLESINEELAHGKITVDDWTSMGMFMFRIPVVNLCQ